MRSLRRSLTLYFLALVGAGVAAVALSADRVIDRALRDKEDAGAEAVRLRTQEHANAAREKFDENLLAQARGIGRVVQVQYHALVQSEFQQFQPVVAQAVAGAGAAGPLPGAVVLGGVQDRRGRPGPLLAMLGREFFAHRLLEKVFLRREDDDRYAQYVQVNGAWGAQWLTPQMGGAAFPFNAKRERSETPPDWEWDRVTLPDGTAGRRVVLKTSLGYNWTPVSRGGGPPRGPDRGSDRDRRPPPTRPQEQRPSEPPPPGDFQPVIFIHVAVPTAALDAQLAAVEASAETERAALAAQSHRDRGRFRLWVVGVGLATFLSIVVGGPLVVRRGLAPVDKLSDAVSRVSPTDFRLDVPADDLTRELMPIHDRLTQTLDALRRAFAREKQAVADISHELRTPLAGLLASLDVALRKPRTADQYKGTLEECRQIGRELSRLVERILVLAALDEGRTQVRPEPLDAAEVAVGCAAVVRPLAAAQGLTFDLDAEPGVELVTDPDKLRDVLLNLLHNAVEYNRPGGSVTLTARAEGDQAVFEVTDTGIGMAADVREHIFERFYRADASRHATGVHAGLGLSLVKEYVDRLGGAIAVTSEPGVGTTFRVTLPRATGADADAPPVAAAVGG